MSFSLKLFFVQVESGECMLIKANDWADAMEIEMSTNLSREYHRSIRLATEDDIAQLLNIDEDAAEKLGLEKFIRIYH